MKQTEYPEYIAVKLPTRETRKKIRKATEITRNILVIAFGIMMLLGIYCADNANLIYPFAFFVVAFICFGIAYGLDHLLKETA